MPSVINSDDGVVSGSAGLKTSGANDGITAFQQNGTESVRITAAGNVGIGTSSPSYRLQVQLPSSGIGTAFRYLGGTNNPGLFFSTNESTTVSQIDASGSTSGILAFATSGVERARIDSSGNVGIGTNSPSALLHLYRNAVAAANIYLQNASTSAGSYATLQFDAGVVTAQLFSDATGAAVAQGAVLRTTSNHPLIFGTNSTERARITSGGDLLVGTTANAGGAGRIGVLFAGNAANGINIQDSTTTSGSEFIAFWNSGGTKIGSISRNGTTNAVLYNTTSDERLKENIIDAPEFGGVIDLIKVRSYDWKSDHTHQRAGFIAQELITIAPEAVHQPKNPEEMMAVDYSKLVPMLVKEIQSLRARVAQLEAKGN